MAALLLANAAMSLFRDDTDPRASIRWSARSVLAPLSDINESFLQLLIDVAKRREAAPSDFIAELREPLCQLSESARAIARGTPVLLVDMEFRNPMWWGAVATDSAKTHTAHTWLTSFPRNRAVRLARSTLMLAWHLAGTDPASCLALLGLSSPVIEIVGALQPQQIERIAERQGTCLRPRWEDRPSVWRHLLSAADDHAAAQGFTVRALQLSCAPARPPSAP